MRARRQGEYWNKGEWGLVECNDPAVTWKTTPWPIDPEEQFRDWPTAEFREAFSKFDLDTAHRLHVALTANGYDPLSDTPADVWLFSYLGTYLKDLDLSALKQDNDPLPGREPVHPTDYGIGKDPLPGEPS